MAGESGYGSEKEISARLPNDEEAKKLEEVEKRFKSEKHKTTEKSERDFLKEEYYAKKIGIACGLDSKELLDFLREEARDRNFDIDFTHNEKGLPTIVLKKSDGEKKDLSDYLPEHQFFADSGKTAMIQMKLLRMVGYNKLKAERRSFFLELGHEMGHTKFRAEKEGDWLSGRQVQKSINKFWRSLKNLGGKLSASDGRKNRERGLEEKSGHKQFDIIASLEKTPDDELIPTWLLRRRLNHRAEEERKSWAYGLKIMKELQKNGYNVFDGFDSVDQIKAYIGYCLLTYEQSEISRLMSKSGESDETYEPRNVHIGELRSIKRVISESSKKEAGEE